jgi:hypothetical protein
VHVLVWPLPRIVTLGVLLMLGMSLSMHIETRLAQPRGHGTWDMDIFKKLGHEMVSTPQTNQLGKTWDIVWKGRGSGYAIHELSLIQCSRFRIN